MPLSQGDPALDYDGSWGDASAGWPSIEFASEEEAERAYVTCWQGAKVPYGSYVLVGSVLRLETEEYKELVVKFFFGVVPQTKVCVDSLRS